ncbi:TetR family transcriptional regulator [Citrobacter amalonaticus]|uniref:TetR family transcriptional regulator n=1 Tax=Citrobacter amalonaticus TaxID=35703 RepID=A0A2S4RUL5_CITAM|nr:TetR/AcrR family transcriptional regulator [Citrobacter amalonaticus]POT56962.1 TetR family transcriptional regulator [Citrobacter amalonaticus]POT72749.1 TetR family transcriptional regulator [Citrobacter amalonaticus]POU63605.1 TetR family transcriptional regulator [Citrobacter amalonaticus]POV03369.1 TetR family transcriptional regulator [Citrobacter amalonaticus]
MSAQKDNETPRRPGRPRGKKSGTANREQLMDIALALFARHGFAPVSLNAIAKEAGVTPAMLHYYFSSRETLVEQLMEERFMPLRNDISQIFVAHPEEPVAALRQLVEALAKIAEKNTWFAPLWMQEIIGEMPVLHQHMRKRFGDEKHHQMLESVRRWQREGKINPALSPELLFTSLISLVLVPFSRTRTDIRLQHIDSQTIVDHALAMMRSGITGKRSPDASGELKD